MSNGSTNIFCDRRVPTAGCLVDYIFCLQLRPARVAPGPSLYQSSRISLILQEIMKLQLPPKNQQQLFSQWDAAIPCLLQWKVLVYYKHQALLHAFRMGICISDEAQFIHILVANIRAEI